MRYLVIGDANSMHIYNFTKNFLLPRGWQVHLLTLSTQPIREQYRTFYRENGVTVHAVAEKGYKGLDKKTLFYRLLNLWRKWRLMHDVPKVDVCHLQSVYKTSVAMALRNKRKFNKLILSYWGGDLEVCSPAVLRFAEKGIKRADAVTVTVQSTLQHFQRIYGHCYDDKVHICRLATAGLDCIHHLHQTSTRAACREAYGIPQDKICITCGYSAYREQHQDLCLAKLRQLPDELRQRLFVIVPMQYGRLHDTAYLDAVQAQADAADFECVILRDFVPFEKSAQLAVATDIYLHLRDTDAFSNALKEHVYAGSRIIKGSWLKYFELEQMQASVTDIDEIDRLTDILIPMLENYSIPQQIELFDPIYRLYSTENINAQWQQVLDTVL